MSTEPACPFFKYGYCKHGVHCWKPHVETKCESTKCDGYGRCKFGESCSYNHVDRNDPVLEELKLVKVKLNLVKVQITETEKNLEINLLFEKLELALGTISKEESKENGDTTMDDERVKSPGINTEVDSGDANSQCSPDGNNEEDKSGKKIKKKKNNKKNDDNKSRQISEIGICDDSQATQFDSGVTSSMFENLEASPLFENNEKEEKNENDESIWLCLCCHTVGEFDTEDELIAHHISHNLEYDDCYLCYIEAPNDGLEYDEANDSFLKRVQSVPSSTEICTAGHQVKTRGRKLGTTWSSEDCTVHAGVLILGTPAAAQVGQGDNGGV